MARSKSNPRYITNYLREIIYRIIKIINKLLKRDVQFVSNIEIIIFES